PSRCSPCSPSGRTSGPVWPSPPCSSSSSPGPRASSAAGPGSASDVDLIVQLFTDPAGFYSAHQLLVGQCGVNALLAISIFVTLYSGQLTLANVGFMAIGGYAAVIMTIHLHTPFVVNVLAGAVLAGLVAFVIGLPVLRLRGVFLAIATV